MSAPTDPARHRPGQAGYRRLAGAMFAGGFATFALLYAPQPLLPLLGEELDLTPAAATLTLAVASAAIGVGLLLAGWLSDVVGRTPVMIGSLALTSALGLLCALAPGFGVLLVLRALQGLALAGLPAVGITYLSEEVDPSTLGSSVGLFIAGNAIGGMGGRLLGGVAAELGGWRVGLAAVAVVGIACAVAFARLLPPSRHFVSAPVAPRAIPRRIAAQLTEPGLARLNLMGALLIAVFVASFNAVGFRLSERPYDLGQAALAAVFLVYAGGSAASATAGRLADRFGRRRVLPAGIAILGCGVALTAFSPLALVVLGIAVLTIGFFAAHAVTAGWVGRRAAAGEASQASALFLVSFYAGASIGGPLGGAAWSRGGWDGVLVLCGVLVAAAFLLALRLARTPPREAALASAP